MRIPQPPGTRGSLRWVQLAVNRHPHLLEAALPGVRWVSPLASDDYAEYRDGSFLRRLGLDALAPKLKAFWPTRGPQWDALGARRDGAGARRGEGAPRGVHLAADAGHGRGAGEDRGGAGGDAGGAGRHGRRGLARYYQFTNRLAHLHFLHREGVPATLLFLNFLGDTDMGGPADAAAWEGAYHVAETALGLPRIHRLSPFIRHITIDVRQLAG